MNGRLPPEVIQRIVRQSFGRFRLCYEDVLKTNPKASGRVTIKFVIDKQAVPLAPPENDLTAEVSRAYDAAEPQTK